MNQTPRALRAESCLFDFVDLRHGLPAVAVCHSMQGAPYRPPANPVSPDTIEIRCASIQGLTPVCLILLGWNPSGHMSTFHLLEWYSRSRRDQHLFALIFAHSSLGSDPGRLQVAALCFSQQLTPNVSFGFFTDSLVLRMATRRCVATCEDLASCCPGGFASIHSP